MLIMQRASRGLVSGTPPLSYSCVRWYASEVHSGEDVTAEIRGRPVDSSDELVEVLLHYPAGPQKPKSMSTFESQSKGKHAAKQAAQPRANNPYGQFTRLTGEIRSKTTTSSSKKVLERVKTASASLVENLRPKITNHIPSKRNKVSTSRETTTIDVWEETPAVAVEQKPPLHQRHGTIKPLATDILQDIEPLFPQKPVDTLQHGLERVLFNPGVHVMRDARSKVYNFPPDIENIPSVYDFAFERISTWTPGSHDPDMRELMKQQDKKFGGSTSSLTKVLCHIYFLLSSWRGPNYRHLSQTFKRSPTTFTPGQRSPAEVTFQHEDGRYVIDSGVAGRDDLAERNVLTWMGLVLERFFTKSTEEFSKLMRTSPLDPSLETDKRRDAYRFSKSDKFVMRSQLDCRDPRLPGTGVFDLKTRACLPIRMDFLNYENNSGYVIENVQGRDESFEQEYFDMIRNAFLKYLFQCRIGNMDGIMVAYHNTKQVFGFQYIPVEEMDTVLFGSARGIGKKVFHHCIQMLEEISEEITSAFPGQSVAATIETLENKGTMQIIVSPVDADDEGKRPLKMFHVHVSSTSDKTCVRSDFAMGKEDAEWAINYQILALDETQEAIERTLASMRARADHCLIIPDGHTQETVEAWFHDLNFSGMPQPPAILNAKPFKDANSRILRLRQLCKDAEARTLLLSQMEQGQHKTVLGDPAGLVNAETRRALAAARTIAAATGFSTDIESDLSVEPKIVLGDPNGIVTAENMRSTSEGHTESAQAVSHFTTEDH